MADKSQNVDGDIRKAMRHFWEAHSDKPTTSNMMLDTRPDEIGAREISEILGMLPEVKGTRVVELGSGIGRFSGHLADKAKSLLVSEFMEVFHEENIRVNGSRPNVEFLLGDATEISLPPNSVDIVFSNWLLMYLDDEEVQTLAKNALSWLQEGGYFFFRESCFRLAGDFKTLKSENPTRYRSPATYSDLIRSVTSQGEDGSAFGFQIIFCKPVKTYIELRDNSSQLCWLVRKEKMATGNTHGFSNFQEFLDSEQYSRNNILVYEKIFGESWVSPGGKETTEEFVSMLNLQEGQRVLDVGSGTGGSAFYMAKEYGAEVTGIDLSSNMVAIAQERHNEIKDRRVVFEIGDATKCEFAEGSFDVIYSRDTILHIKDKLSLFKSFLKWLKPGGKLLISDYCCKDGELSEQFKKYVAQRGYNLLSPLAYGKVLEDAGFVNVNAQDKTDLFVEILHKELARFIPTKEEFLKEFPEESFNSLINGWQDKVERCGQGDQRWGLFFAEKPAP